jgi:hypothetical protein
VLGRTGQWVEAPESVARAGLCYATGFVHDWFCERTAPKPEDRACWEKIVAHGLFKPYIIEDNLISLRKSLEDFGRFAADHPDHSDVPRYAEFAKAAAHYGDVRDGKAGHDTVTSAYLAMEPFFVAERALLLERFRAPLAAVLRLHAQARGASGDVVASRG